MTCRLHPVFLLTCFLCGTTMLLGCDDPYAPPLPGAAGRGETIYAANCKPCHEDPTLELRTKPPNLAGLFDHALLPSGAPATDEQVRKTIQEGKGIMPPFGQVLDKENIDDLVMYLHKKK